jgi:hypothetical protein
MMARPGYSGDQHKPTWNRDYESDTTGRLRRQIDEHTAAAGRLSNSVLGKRQASM